MIPVLVIGFGNDLRGDDAVGRHVARAVASWECPGVRVLDMHQLTPELAEPLSGADQAIFVDACMSDSDRSVHLRSLETIGVENLTSHGCDPEWLLALTSELYGRRPKSWLLTVPVFETELAQGLSSPARALVAEALSRIEEWMHDTAGIVDHA
jgi:hydrogenase maturation protease